MAQFDYQTFLTYIVVAIIAAIVIHLCFKLYMSKKIANSTHEPMCSINKSNNSTTNDVNDNHDNNNANAKNDIAAFYNGINKKLSKKYPRRTMYSKVKNNNYNDNINYLPPLPPSADDNIIELAGISQQTPEFTACTSCDHENTYTKEFLLADKEQCPVNPKYFSETDIQRYRNQFVNFRNNINQSSTDLNPDPVDLINLRILEGNGDVTDNMIGQKISDIYDALTTGQIKAQIDDVGNSPDYQMRGPNAMYYTEDQWVYKNDRVMNGAAFMNNPMTDVTGYDSNADYPMATNY